MATAFESTPAGRAAGYGWSLAVINSNPDLKRLFAEATAADWTPDHFVAMVRGTNWFKKNSDAVRQATILKRADPATYRSRLQTASAHMTTMANQMGATMTPGNIAKFANDVVAFGWSDEQVKLLMIKYVRAGKAGVYAGGAGAAQAVVNQIAGDYGGVPTPGQMAMYVRGIVTGRLNAENVRSVFSKAAESRYPALAVRFRAGETLKEIASPYLQSYAKTLEVPQSTIALTDPKVQAALMAKDAKNKPVVRSIWEFEQDLRKDPRYMKTQQAQDQGMTMARQVLKDFGVQS